MTTTSSKKVIVCARRRRGQTFIEFLLTVFAYLTVAFMTVQVGLGFGVANYIHYATFMAARALLTGYESEEKQKEKARSVLSKMLKKGDGKDRFDPIAKGTGNGSPAGFELVGSTGRSKGGNPRDSAWEQGVVYKFNAKLYMLPIAPGAKRGQKNAVELESETWLGRDPTIEECKKQLGDRLVDNGC